MLAKFPHLNDEFDVVTWEAVALTLAGRAGMPVPRWRLEQVQTTFGWRLILASRRSMTAAC